MVRPCSAELDGQNMVYHSASKGLVLATLALSQDRVGYHVLTPDGHDVVSEHVALRGLVTGEAPCWPIADAEDGGREKVVAPGDVLWAGALPYRLLQILQCPGAPARSRAVFRAQGLREEPGQLLGLEPEGAPDLHLPSAFQRRSAVQFLGGRLHVSPSAAARLAHVTGALADGFLRIVRSTGQPGEAVFEVPCSRGDFMEFVARAGTVRSRGPGPAAPGGAGGERGLARAAPGPGEDGASDGGATDSGAASQPSDAGGDGELPSRQGTPAGTRPSTPQGAGAGGAAGVHVVVAPGDFPKFKAMVMDPGGFPSFPERSASGQQRRGQRRRFLSVVRGNIDLVLQPSTCDRGSSDADDAPERAGKGGQCADRLLVRFFWTQEQTLA